MEIVFFAIERYGIPALVVSVLAFLLTFGIKIPYKIGTAKIKTEAYRKLANAPIFIMPFGLGVVCWLGYLHIFKVVAEWQEYVFAGLVCGALAIIIYAAVGQTIETAVRVKIQKNADEKAIKAEIEKDTSEMVEAVEVVSDAVKAKKSVKEVVNNVLGSIKALFAKKVEKAKECASSEEKVVVNKVADTIAEEADILFDKYVRK